MQTLQLTLSFQKAPSAGSVPVDFSILAIPIAIVWPHRNISLSSKIRIICLLGTGGIASCFSVWRMVQLAGFQNALDPTTILVLVDIAE